MVGGQFRLTDRWPADRPAAAEARAPDLLLRLPHIVRQPVENRKTLFGVAQQTGRVHRRPDVLFSRSNANAKTPYWPPINADKNEPDEIGRASCRERV